MGQTKAQQLMLQNSVQLSGACGNAQQGIKFAANALNGHALQQRGKLVDSTLRLWI